MRFKKKKWVLFILVLSIIVSITVAFPFLINTYVSHTIDVKQFKTKLVETVKEISGLDMSIQGVLFQFPEGIIFTGVKIWAPTPKDGSTTIMRSENLVLELSLAQIFRKDNPFSGFLIAEGKFFPMALSGAEWKNVLKNINNYRNKISESDQTLSEKSADPVISENENETLKKKFLDIIKNPEEDFYIRAPEIKIILPEYMTQKTGTDDTYRANDSVFMALHFEPFKSTFQTSLFLDKKTKENRNVTIKGSWEKDRKRFLNYKYQNIPLSYIFQMIRHAPVFPAEVTMLMENLNIKAGVSSGNGSMDSFENGVGINIDGSYEMLDLILPPNPYYNIEIKKGAGTYNYNIAAEDFFNGPNYAKFEFRQPNISIDYLYKDIDDPDKKKPKDHSFLFNTSINFTKKSKARENNAETSEKNIVLGTLASLNVAGQIDFETSYKYPKGDIYLPTLKADCRNMVIDLTDSPLHNKNRKEGVSEITIKNAKLQQSGKENMNFSAEGTILDAPFRLGGNSKSSFQINFQAKNPLLKFHQNTDMSLNIYKMKYQDIGASIYQVADFMTKSGTAKNARRAEDEGQLSYYRFMAPSLQNAFINDTNLNLKIKLNEMQEGKHILPESFEILVQKRNRSINITLPPTRTNYSEIEFKYNVTLQESMPVHFMIFKASVKNNPVSIPAILGANTPPHSFSIDYSMNGQGWLPYDILNHTYSKLHLELEKSDLNGLIPVQIIKHKLQLDDAELFAEKFKFSRYTNGGTFTFPTIQFESSNISAYGSGSYSPAETGTFDIAYKKDKSTRGNIKLKIADYEWSLMSP